MPVADLLDRHDRLETIAATSPTDVGDVRHTHVPRGGSWRGLLTPSHIRFNHRGTPKVSLSPGLRRILVHIACSRKLHFTAPKSNRSHDFENFCRTLHCSPRSIDWCIEKKFDPLTLLVRPPSHQSASASSCQHARPAACRRV